MDKWIDVFREPKDVSKNLNDLITLSLDFQVRHECTATQIDAIKSIVIQCWTSIANGDSESDMEVLVQSLKLLRNLCAGVEKNQDRIGEEKFVKEVVELLKWNQEQLHFNTTLSKVCVQLIGNVCVGNPNGQEVAWKHFYPHMFQLLCYQKGDGMTNMCCMVLLNCVRGNKTRMSELTTHNGNLIAVIFKQLKCSNESDWIILLFEKVLEKCSLKCLCELLSPFPQERTSLLEFVLAYSDDTNNDAITDIESAKPNTFLAICSSHSNLLYLQDHYIELIAWLLSKEGLLSSLYFSKLSNSLIPEDEEMFKRFTSVLGLLCQASCRISLLEILQKERSLLSSSLDLLEVLSKLDGSIDSARHRSYLSDSSKQDTSHPMYCLKRDLIRIIGNLCYHSQLNQDLVHDFIPLLLNQCSIDNNNPYIMQWVMWGIRNICEENPANQALIKQIEQKGKYNLEELRQNFGCEVEVDKNGKLRLKKKM